MICEGCYGTGYLPDAHPPQPCPACQGVGYAYCCESSDVLQGDDLSPIAVTEMHMMTPEHEASPNCWCRPVLDADDPTGTVWIHSDAQ